MFAGQQLLLLNGSNNRDIRREPGRKENIFQSGFIIFVRAYQYGYRGRWGRCLRYFSNLGTNMEAWIGSLATRAQNGIISIIVWPNFCGSRCHAIIRFWTPTHTISTCITRSLTVLAPCWTLVAWGGKLKYTISKNFINGLRANIILNAQIILWQLRYWCNKMSMYFIGDMISIFFHYYMKMVKFINEMYLQNVLNNEVKKIGDAWWYGYACNILRYLLFPLLSYYAVVYLIINVSE